MKLGIFGITLIDPLRFLAGCRKRRLNQALCVLSLSVGFVCVLLFLKTVVLLTADRWYPSSEGTVRY